MQSTAALVTLANGKTYAATEHRFDQGWLHITGARYWKVSRKGETRTRFGRCGAFSWPREAVREVRPADPLPGGVEDLLTASASS